MYVLFPRTVKAVSATGARLFHTPHSLLLTGAKRAPVLHDAPLGDWFLLAWEHLLGNNRVRAGRSAGSLVGRGLAVLAGKVRAQVKWVQGWPVASW